MGTVVQFLFRHPFLTSLSFSDFGNKHDTQYHQAIKQSNKQNDDLQAVCPHVLLSDYNHEIIINIHLVFFFIFILSHRWLAISFYSVILFIYGTMNWNSFSVLLYGSLWLLWSQDRSTFIRHTVNKGYTKDKTQNLFLHK